MRASSQALQHYFITGASSGIGRALAVSLAKAGHKVSATARRTDKLAELANDYPTIQPITCDVTDSVSVKDAVQTAKTYNGQIDIAVLNAGIYVPQDARHMTVDPYIDHMDVNYFGVIRCIEALLPDMVANKQGHLALMASVAGYRGLPRAAAYSPTKAAIISLAESMMFDLQNSGIKLQVINPGFVETEATNVNDFEMPDIISAELAAKNIQAGLLSQKFEIAFPRAFVRKMRFLKFLPASIYFRLMKRIISK